MYFLLTPDIGTMIKEYEPVGEYGHKDVFFFLPPLLDVRKTAHPAVLQHGAAQCDT